MFRDPPRGVRGHMKDPAISEVAGTMVLIGVVVLGMIIVNLVVFSTPTNTRVPSLEASMSNRSTLVTIVHQGGDSIPFGEFKILVDGVDRTGDFANSGTYPWSVGETLSYNGTALPQSAIMIYNGTGTGGTILLQTRFPWGVYIGGGRPGPDSRDVTATPTPPDYPWYDCAWGYRKNITIDHTKVSGTQTNFPVLISLSSDSDLSSLAQSDGDDILFTSSDGTTKLSHEIESYSSGTLVAWVKVSSLSSATDTTIMMYYGNSGTSSQQDATNVWDASYKAVWHLEEAVTDESTTGTHYDSTLNGNNGAQNNNGPVTGKVGGAQAFDGTSDWIQGPNAASLIMTSQATMEAWVYLVNSNDNQKIVGKTSHPPTGGYLLAVENGMLYPEFWDSSGTDYTFTSGSVSSAAWTHLAVTWTTGSTMVGYINGAQVNSIAASASNLNSTATSGWMRMGTTPWSNPPTQFFVNGRIDEVRLSSSARSAEWIATGYNNQNSPSTFISAGSQVTTPFSCSGIIPTPTPAPLEGLPWYDCDWGYRKNITIDHTKVSGTQTSFPVLVSLAADAGLSSHAQADGDDIFFTDSNGLKIPHEIESYSSGTLVTWVKVPSVSSAADTTIVMYYGNAGTSSQQNPTSVWDNSYKAVWHLGEAVTDNAVTAGVHKDSTENDADGTQTNNNDVTGKIGLAQDFEGDARDEYIEIPNSGSMEGIQEGDYTVEAWFYSDTTPPGSDPAWNSYYAVIGKEGYNEGLEMNYARDIGIHHWLASGPSNKPAQDGPYNNLQWYHLVGVVNRTYGTTKIYIDGVNEQTTSWTAGSATYEYGTLPWRIGIFSTGRVDYAAPANGKIDEVRLSNVGRSPQWILTEYNNENSPSTFYSVGSEEGSNCGGLTVFDTCDWPLRKKITIDKTKVAGTQTDFPVLVSLASDSDLAADAQDDGDDLVFTASDGTTQLPHEIESFDGTTGALTAWVRVPSISSATNTDIYLYYGNPSSTNQQDPTGVWDSNYVGVWHMKESGTGAQGEFRDSTSYANNGQGGDGNSLLVPAQVAGKVGYAQNFSIADGKWDFIDMGQNPVLDISGNQITLEAWVQHEVTSNPPYGHGGNSYGILNHKGWYNGYRIAMEGDDSQCWYTGSFCIDFQLPGQYNRTQTSAVLTADTWYHVAGTYNGSWMATFINGQVAPNMAAKTDNILPSGTGEKDVWVGHGDMPYDVGWSTEWVGKLDEVRISKVGRSDSWIRTEYNNMNSPSTFSTIGTEEASPCGTPTPTPTTTPVPDWYDCDWDYRKNIIINHTKVSGTQTNFPVLVSLSSDTDLSSHAQSDGDDILFTESDGTTKLSHEIESYSTGTLVAWVNVSSINSATDTTIMMYYGNSGASSQQNRNGVWDTDYKGVWHLSSNLLDSTSNGNDGTSSGSTSATGKMASARSFDGNDYITQDDDPTLDMTAGQAFTISAWVKSSQAAASGTWPAIIRKVNDATRTKGYGLYLHQETLYSNKWYMEIEDTTYYSAYGNSNIADGSWHYIVGVRSGTTGKTYEDGNTADTVSVSSGDLSSVNTLTFAANSMSPPDTLFYTGSVDEVRVSKVARSAQWIATEYANMNSPSTFISVGSQVESGCPVPPPWDPCSWSSRKKITINHLKVSGTQTNFPVLVSLASDTDLAADAQDDGDDITFTASDGTTQLPHEIESFDGGTGALTAWVKVPSINSATDTDIYLHYGNAAASSQQNATGVWDANYLGVWHLGENVIDESGSGTHNDSTGQGFTGKQYNNSRTSGKIGWAQSFDGANDWISVDPHPVPTSQLTMEAWVYLPALDPNEKILSTINRVGAGPWYGYQMGVYSGGASEVMYSEIYDSSSNHYQIQQGSFPVGTWTYLANTWTTNGQFIGYINGTQIASIAAGSSNIGYTPGPQNIGAPGWVTVTTFLFEGTIDEVRISNTARSAQWIATGYNNTYSPSTFITVGSEEGTCGGGGSCTLAIDTTSTGTTATSGLTISHTTSGSDRLMLVGISINAEAGAPTVSSVTYNGVALSNVGSQASSDSKMRMAIWRLVGPATGTHNVVITLSAVPDGATAGVMTFTGADATTPLGTFASAQGESGTATVTVSSAAGELVFDTVAQEGSSNYDLVPGAGQTERWDLFESNANGGGSTESGAASVTMSWTFTSEKWATGAVPVKPCGSPATPTPTPTPEPTPAYPWYDCGWSYRKNITINHAQVSGTQDNFPVLVNLSSDSGLATHAQADFDDILFTSSDGLTKIPHQIESYTSTTGALIAWVNVSSINSATDTTILMYYGNPGVSSQQSPTQVWDSSYKAVWHFTGNMLDSTSNGNTGTSATTSEQTGGKIANDRFNPSTVAANNITIGDGASVQNLFAGGGTFEAWVYPVAVGNNEGRIGDKSSSTASANGWSLSVNTTAGNLNSISFRKGFSTVGGVWNTSKNSITLNAWNHVAVTYNNDSTANNPTIYINGAQANIMRRGPPTGTPQSDIGRTLRLFNYVGAGTRGLQGYLDEVRASRTVRSAGWILTEYNNQNSPSTFISVGDEKSSPCGLGPGPWYVQSAGQHYGAVSSGTVTLPLSTTAGRLLIVSLVFDSQAVSVSSVSDSVNGAAYYLALAPTNIDTWGRLYTYYVNNSQAGGPITATITLSGAPATLLDIFFTEYGGIALASPKDQSSAGSASSGTSMDSGSQTTTTASELIYGFGADSYECHATSPYIDRETTDGQCVMDRNVTATGSYSVTSSQSESGTWALQMVTFRGQ
jgi:hypothetical protein